MLHLEYLKEHRRTVYTVMMMNDTLLKHFAEIVKTCHEIMDKLIPQIAEREGVNETLKATDQMEWVRRMNSIQSRVEEFIYHDYVYGGFER